MVIFHSFFYVYQRVSFTRAYPVETIHTWLETQQGKFPKTLEAMKPTFSQWTPLPCIYSLSICTYTYIYMCVCIAFTLCVYIYIQLYNMCIHMCTCMCIYIYTHNLYIYIWVSYNISLTWNDAFPKAPAESATSLNRSNFVPTWGCLAPKKNPWNSHDM